MSRDFTGVAKQLYSKVCSVKPTDDNPSSFDNIELNGENTGEVVVKPDLARTIMFDYVYADHNYGSVILRLVDSEDNQRGALEVAFSDSITKQPHDVDESTFNAFKSQWTKFLQQIKSLAVGQNMLSFKLKNTVRPMGLRDRQVNHVQTQPTPDLDTVAESKLYGTTKSSYQKAGPVRIIVRHSKPVVDEVRGSRSRHIKAIYIENDQGERFKMECNSLKGARAMAQHVSHGGSPYDELGSHISRVVQEHAKLSPFVRNMKHRVFEDPETASMLESAFEYHALLNNTLRRMAGPKGYKACAETFEPEEQQLDEFDVNAMRERFVKKTFNDRLEDALPLVNKAHNMREADKLSRQFEGWANGIVEEVGGSDVTDPTKITNLKELLSNPLLVGIDGANATGALSSIIDDPELFNEIGELAQQNPEADAVPVITAWLEQHHPELIPLVSSGGETSVMDTDTQQAPPPAEAPGSGAGPTTGADVTPAENVAEGNAPGEYVIKYRNATNGKWYQKTFNSQQKFEAWCDKHADIIDDASYSFPDDAETSLDESILSESPMEDALSDLHAEGMDALEEIAAEYGINPETLKAKYADYAQGREIGKLAGIKDKERSERETASSAQAAKDAAEKKSMAAIQKAARDAQRDERTYRLPKQFWDRMEMEFESQIGAIWDMDIVASTAEESAEHGGAVAEEALSRAAQRVARKIGIGPLDFWAYGDQIHSWFEKTHHGESVTDYGRAVGRDFWGDNHTHVGETMTHRSRDPASLAARAVDHDAEDRGHIQDKAVDDITMEQLRRLAGV